MFNMQLPWWEFIARGGIVYSALLIMVRLSGKRTVGQFTPFDLLVVMLLSEAVSNSLSGGDDSLIGGLLVAATLIALNLLVAFSTSRSRKIANVVDGTAVLLGRDGRIFIDVAKGSRVGETDIEQALREADCPLEKMQYAFLEPDGSISILKKKSE
jgi:uncharacterized membrane protein YcaP (DUF421 family)